MSLEDPHQLHSANSSATNRRKASNHAGLASLAAHSIRRTSAILIVAEIVRDALGLDEVRLVVANNPWQKTSDRTISDPDLRLEMLQVALDGAPGLTASDVEIDLAVRATRSSPSSTCSRHEPDAEWLSIVGADAAAGLDTWHRADELAGHGRGGGGESAGMAEADGRTPPPGWRWHAVEVPSIGVSSTDLRFACRRGSFDPVPHARAGGGHHRAQRCSIVSSDDSPHRHLAARGTRASGRSRRRSEHRSWAPASPSDPASVDIAIRGGSSRSRCSCCCRSRSGVLRWLVPCCRPRPEPSPSSHSPASRVGGSWSIRARFWRSPRSTTAASPASRMVARPGQDTGGGALDHGAGLASPRRRPKARRTGTRPDAMQALSAELRLGFVETYVVTRPRLADGARRQGLLRSTTPIRSWPPTDRSPIPVGRFDVDANTAAGVSRRPGRRRQSAVVAVSSRAVLAGGAGRSAGRRAIRSRR